MSVVYCHTCDRMIDTDYHEPCDNCYNEGRAWCWNCSIGVALHLIGPGDECPGCGCNDAWSGLDELREEAELEEKS